MAMEEQGSYINRIKRQKYMDVETFKGKAYEEALEKERKLVASLQQEIAYRDGQIVKFQLRCDEMAAHFRQVVNGLTERINMQVDEKAKVKEAQVSEINKLQSQNMELDCRLRSKSTAFEESKTQRYLVRARLEKEIIELKEKLQNQNASAIGMDKLESQISVLKAQLKEKFMALQSLESLNKTLISKDIESRQELLESTTLRTELEEKSEKLQSMESLNNTLKLEELRNMLIQKKKELITTQELQQARLESITLKAELEEKSKTLQYHQNLNNTLSKELKEKLQNQNALATGIDKLESQISVLKTELEEKSMALQSLESLNKTLISKEFENRQELLEARNVSTTLRTELEEKSETMRNLETLYNTLVLKDLRSTEQLQEARDENSTLRTELEEKAEKLMSLESRNNTLGFPTRDQMEMKEQENTHYKLKGNVYEDALEKERNLVESLIQESEHKDEQIAKMQQRYDEMLASIRQVVSGLVDKIDARNEKLKEMEQMHQNKVKMLHDEAAKLSGTHMAEIIKLQSQNMELDNKLWSKCMALENCKTQRNLDCLRLEKEIKVLKEQLQNQNGTGVENIDLDSVILTTALESLNNTLVTQELETKEKLQEARNESITIRKELEEESVYLEDLTNTLILKERTSRKELQEARSESITGLMDILTNRTPLVIKRMGEIDGKVFQEACLRKFPDDHWEEKAAMLCSSWEEHIGDANWHPFKNVNTKGKLEEVVDEDDVRLKELRKEYGEAVYKTVANALMEMNQYNPSGRYLVSEIWNPKEGRSATMKEIVQFLVKLVKKSLKRKR